MSDMKCPFCQQELKHEKTTGIYCCPTIFVDCPLGLGTGAFGTKELWQELIRTRKALDVAVKAMKSAKYFRLEHCMCCGHDPQKDEVYIKLKNALEQITTLEQKDVK